MMMMMMVVVRWCAAAADHYSLCVAEVCKRVRVHNEHKESRGLRKRNFVAKNGMCTDADQRMERITFGC